MSLGRPEPGPEHRAPCAGRVNAAVSDAIFSRGLVCGLARLVCGL